MVCQIFRLSIEFPGGDVSPRFRQDVTARLGSRPAPAPASPVSPASPAESKAVALSYDDWGYGHHRRDDRDDYEHERSRYNRGRYSY